MCNTYVYLRSHHRRPVRLTRPVGLRDTQQELPRSWCGICGSEIYGRVCPACREVRSDEISGKPLPDLHKSAHPLPMRE